MAVMVEDFKASPKRELKRTKAKIFSRSSLIEVLSQEGKVSSYTAQDGTVRMKILVKKQDLKKLLNNATTDNDICRPNHTSSISSSPASSIEQRLYDLMRKKKANAQAKGRNNSSSWRPVLHSIPEEH